MPNKTTYNISMDTLPDSVDNALENLSDEPTKEIGLFIRDILYRCFGNSHYKTEQMQLLRKRCLAELDNRIIQGIKYVPSEKLIKPNLQTLMLALNNAEPCLDSEELRERFATLITRACNTDYEKFVHPSYSSALGQMSPFDAKILKFYVDNKPDRFITYTYKSSDGKHFDRIPYMFDSYPNADESPLVSLSISVLMRLGILAIHDDAVMHRVTDSPFMETEFYKRCERERIENGEYQSSVINGQVSVITPFGQTFIHSCF